MILSHSVAPLVLFDLDGTLVDSAPDLHLALSRLMTERGREPLSAPTVRALVSKGGTALLRAGFPDLGDDAHALLLPRFLDLYAEALAVESRLFEGIGEVLAGIARAGSRWGIVTNKPEYLARGVTTALGLADEMSILIGGDSLPRRKPAPDQLLHACRQLAVEPQQAVYVGDDERDIVAARAAGIKSVAAAWGYRAAGERVEQWQPDAIAVNPIDLLNKGLMGVAVAARAMSLAG